VQWTSDALGSTVDRGQRGHLAGAWRASARARQSLLQVAEGDEGDEAVPEGCSPEHEHR
jgi:hypothetical protein